MIAAHAPLIAPSHGPATNILNTLRLRAAAMRGPAVEWVSQTLCGLSGHAMMLHFESTRLSLQCMSCGRTTPGWSIQTRQEASSHN